MADLPLYTSTIRRSRGELPQLPLVNMFSEAAITQPKQFVLLSYPGLQEVGVELGPGPVSALLLKDGVASGALVGVSGGNLYVGNASVGVVNGSSAASIAGNEIGVIATQGRDAGFYDGSVYSGIAFPDGANVRKVFEQGGRFLFLRSGSQKWYWTAPLADMLDGDGEIIVDGLDYASAESEPDQLLDGLAMEDTVVLGGANSIEFWTKTGDLELPYVPIQGRVFQKGVRATGCMALFDNSFAWVGPNNIVYRAGNIPERISDAGHEELIAASETCRVDAYFFEGHEFLKIGLDGITIEYDAQTRQWTERKTGIGQFRGGPVAAGPQFGSIVDGNVYVLFGREDIDGFQERSFCTFLPLNGGTVPVDNIVLRTNPGNTAHLGYPNPTVEFIQSYDGGQTFDAPLPEYLGEQGEYRREVEWRALGLADAPGFFGRFRVTDPVDFAVSGVSINEAHGGRSR